MKNKIKYFSSLFFLALSLNGFASAKLNKGGSDADPNKPAEATSHFTLPIGFPVSLASHDSAFDNNKRDTSKNVIKGQTLARKKIYQVNIVDDNSISGWRQTEEAFRQAEDMNADYILIHVDDYNAYNTANRIRNQLYHYKTPVLLYVEKKNKSNNSIYPLTADTLAQLRNQANAAAHFPNGIYNNSRSKKENAVEEKRPYIVSLGKKCEWNQNLPAGRQGYNYSNTESSNGLTSSTLTKTLSDAGIENADIINYDPSPIGKLVDNLSGTFFSLILMIMILAGFYFELRSIAKGMSMFIAVCASLLLFASHYFEGDQNAWLALLFSTGVILTCRDVYYSTRNSIAGIFGSLFILSSFVLCLYGSEGILGSVLMVTLTFSFSIFICINMERRILNLKFISERTDQDVPITTFYTGRSLSSTS